MSRRLASYKIALVIALIVGGILGALLAERTLMWHTSNSTNPSTTGGPKGTSSPYFDYIVVIVMENKSLNQTYGNSCLGNCSYITQLADAYGIALNYSGAGHRSLPNYLTLTSGANYSYSPFMDNCAPQVCSINGQNIIDTVEETHRTWKIYLTNFPGGTCNGLGPLTPFVYYVDFYNNSTRCSHIVDANRGHHGKLLEALPTSLLSDLNDIATAPNFIWLAPTGCDIGYAVCNATSVIDKCTTVTGFSRCVSQANDYLSLLVPRILNSTIFRTQRAVLFITWDEGGGNVLSTGSSCPGVGPTYPKCDDRIPAIFVGPSVKSGFKTNASFSHYSFVKTLEVAWNLPPITQFDPRISSKIDTQFDSRIGSMIDFFTTKGAGP